MAMLIVKYALSALLIVVVSEVAKNSEKFGAFIGALPLVAITIICWLYIETKDTHKVAEYSKYTFWYVLPTLPAFLILPVLLKKGLNIWLSLAILGISTIALFYVASLVSKKFGVTLF